MVVSFCDIFVTRADRRVRFSRRHMGSGIASVVESARNPLTAAPEPHRLMCRVLPIRERMIRTWHVQSAPIAAGMCPRMHLRARRAGASGPVERQRNPPRRRSPTQDLATTACRLLRSYLVSSGRCWSVQGNLLAAPSVVEAMAAGYEASHGALVTRMLATLDAAERAGGDLRGRQSAVIRIVSGLAESEAGADESVDLRVCDHVDPLGEMRRLVMIDQAYREMERGHAAIDDNRPADALVNLDAAVEPGHADELEFWRAIGLIRLGRVDEAVDTFGRLVSERPMYAEFLNRVAEVDPVADDLRNAWNR